MQHIMVDILRRAWYVIVPAFALSVVLNATGFSRFAVFLYIVGPIILKLDRENRTSTVLQTLPVSSAGLAKIYWFIGVVLFSLLNLVWLPALGVLTNSPRMDAWPHVLIAFIGMGYASLMVLVVAQLPRTPGETTFVKEIFGAAWIGLLCGSFFLTSFLATDYAENSPWFYVALAASPALILGSYVSAMEVIKEQRSRTNEPKPRAVLPGYHRGLVPMQMVVISAGVGICYACVFIPLILVMAHSPFGKYLPELIRFDLLMLALVVAALGTKWTNSIRAIRILPLSSVQLTASLAAPPLVSLFTATGILSLVLPWVYEPNIMSGASAFLAVGLTLSLCLNALSLRFGARIVSVMPGILMLMNLIMVPTPFLVPIALLISCGAFYVTKHLLETSGAVYRQKLTGQNLSQR